MGKVYHKSEKMDWETPDDIYAPLEDEFGFTLDVAASRHNHKCDDYFSIDDDALSREWSGVCWMNPPYGREIGKWVQKAYDQKEHGVTTVCLVPARTDTKWWSIFWDHDLHRPRYGRDEVRFLKGRIKFVGAEASAPFPSAILVFRGHTAAKWCAKCSHYVYAACNPQRECGLNQDFFNTK